MQPQMPFNLVSIHLDFAARNSAGTLYSNSVKKVAVLRWESHEDQALMLELADSAGAELELLGADTLIYDLRRLPEADGQGNDIAARLRCLSKGVVRRWGTLTCGEARVDAHPIFKASLHGAQAAVASTFKDIASKLEAMSPDRPGPKMTDTPPMGFYATYAGSVYFLPGITTTVIRTAGNASDLALAKLLYLDGLELSKNLKANAVIVDTSAAPPLTDLNRYSLAYEAVFLPLATAGIFNQMVHVRTGDALVSDGVPPLGPLVTSFGVTYFDVHSMKDAVELLRILHGKRAEDIDPDCQNLI